MTQSERITGKDLWVGWTDNSGQATLTGDYTAFDPGAEHKLVELTAGADPMAYYATTHKDFACKLEIFNKGAAGTALMNRLAEGLSGTLLWASKGTAVGVTRRLAAVVSKVGDSLKFADGVRTSIEFKPQGPIFDMNNLYLVDEQFANDGAASGTMDADPGRGRWTVTDTASKLSKSSGILVCAGGQASPTWGDPGLSSPDAAIFPTNRVLDGKMRQRSNATYTARLGWRDGSTLYCNASFISTYQGAWIMTPLFPSISLNTWYQVRIISSGERIYSFIRTIGGTNWTFTGSQRKSEAANLYPAWTNNDWIGDLDDIQVYDSSGWGELGLYTAYAASGGTLTGTADAWAEATWTVQSAEMLDIQVRRTDDNNTLIIRCDQAGGTIKLIEKSSGTETERASASQTWTASNTYTIGIWLSGTSVWVYVFDLFVGNNATKIVTTSTVQQTATGVKTGGGGWLKELIVYPLTVADASFITPATLRTPKNVLAYGDSKTAGNATDSYVQHLCRRIGAAETPTRIARGGYSTNSMKALIDADLAAAVGTPDYITYNLGANDVNSVSDWSAWETDTAYILDAMHAKWPAAQIYLMRIWRRSYGTESNTLATHQATVLASRSTWAHAGPDERVFLENGDDGARYTQDGVHPRAQDGYILTARQWQTALGL